MKFSAKLSVRPALVYCLGILLAVLAIPIALNTHIHVETSGGSTSLGILGIIVTFGILIGLVIGIVGLVRYLVTKKHNEWCWAGAMICMSVLGLFGVGALIFGDSPQDKNKILITFADAAFICMLIAWVQLKYRPPGKL